MFPQSKAIAAQRTVQTMVRSFLLCLALFFLALGFSFGQQSAEETAIEALRRDYYLTGRPVSGVCVSESQFINTEALKYLKDLPGLQTVEIRGPIINFGNRHLIHFAGLKKLVNLNLDYNENIGDAGVAHLKGLTHLRNLN